MTFKVIFLLKAFLTRLRVVTALRKLWPVHAEYFSRNAFKQKFNGSVCVKPNLLEVEIYDGEMC